MERQDLDAIVRRLEAANEERNIHEEADGTAHSFFIHRFLSEYSPRVTSTIYENSARGKRLATVCLPIFYKTLTAAHAFLA